ncbi:hypothetical protein GGD57_002448 [Rhizobium esperanzae]|uniref:Uncharacterized protein n=1 Tax=Rhizobium esperanzae TaxID=1967781 RepID=A0A7W6W4T9_9HYPH|nr:hypothetical protein [Rhizobium esperanzae]
MLQVSSDSIFSLLPLTIAVRTVKDLLIHSSL